MRIVRNETCRTVNGIGEVFFGPLEMGGTYFHPKATHRIDFRFHVESGREYWGSVISERRDRYVLLYTRDSRNNGGRTVPANQKVEWRASLISELDAIIDYEPEEKPEPEPEPEPVKTIDMTPTWSGIVPILLAALENGTDTGKRMAREEITRMARVADEVINR
jgi:hypothetical protein